MTQKSITIAGVEKVVSIERSGDGYVVKVGDNDYQVGSAEFHDRVLTFFTGPSTHRACVSRNAFGTQISIAGRDYVVPAVNEDDDGGSGDHHHGDGSVEAPMPGSIVSVAVQVGDTVKVGDPVLILESMKMQNEIVSPVPGEVTAVKCKAGEQVAYGAVLVEIEPAV